MHMQANTFFNTFYNAFVNPLFSELSLVRDTLHGIDLPCGISVSCKAQRWGCRCLTR